MRPEDLWIGNSAGFAKHNTQAELLARLPITHPVLGGFTWSARAGNAGEVYGEDDTGGRLNRLGLPNPGLSNNADELRAMVTLLSNAGMHVSINFAGFTAGEYADCADTVYCAGADEGEVNFGCPNTEAVVPSFYPALIWKNMIAIGDRTPPDFPLAVKLSPYSDPRLLEQVADCLNQLTRTGSWQKRELRVVLSNTFPNAYAFKPGTLEPLLSGDGFGGFSGNGYQPIVLGQVKRFRELLDPRIGITAAGDIEWSLDVLRYAECGADRFQVGNAFMWHEDGRVFERILAALS